MFYYVFMKMRLKTWQKPFQLFSLMVFCIAFLLFWGCVLAAGTETWYTDFEITSWEAVSTTSGQTTWSYTWSLTNHDTDVVAGEFNFVDAVKLANGYYACKADNQSGVFGQYLHMDGSTSFLVQPGETITWTINFDFPASYSGTYHGCIVYSVRDDEDMWGDAVMNMTSRKAKHVSVTLQASQVSIQIVANLDGRWSQDTMNLYGYESRWKILFYPPNHSTGDLPIASWYVIMDHEWSGILMWVTITAGTYDVVYKWWHHLASYIPNVAISPWVILDFVLDAIWVWEVAHNIQMYNWWWTYQRAWDMPTTSNDYDHVINMADLSVLAWHRCTPKHTTIPSGHICDINNDGEISEPDSTTVIYNILHPGGGIRLKDAVYSNWAFTWFGYVDYPLYYNQ